VKSSDVYFHTYESFSLSAERTTVYGSYPSTEILNENFKSFTYSSVTNSLNPSGIALIFSVLMICNLAFSSNISFVAVTNKSTTSPCNDPSGLSIVTSYKSDVASSTLYVGASPYHEN
jgi:hypothetical protein